MLSKQKIARINELAAKSKGEGLSKKEEKEQQQLRTEYIKTFRSSFKNSLNSVKVVDPEGNDVTPQKLKDEQERGSKN